MRLSVYTLCAFFGAFLFALPASAQPPGADRIATLLGGVSDEDINDILVAPDGSVYVAGTTTSADFPATDGAYDATLGTGTDAFVAHLSADLTTLLAATLVGVTNSFDRGYGIALAEDALFLAGSTTAENFPVSDDAVQTGLNSELGYPDAFVARLSLDLSTLEAATYIGATRGDEALDIAIDFEGDVVIAGVTDGANFPLSDGAFSPNSGPVEGPFVTRLNPSLSELRASTRLNGSGEPVGLVLDPETGDAFITGRTRDQNYPATPGAFDETCGTDGECDFFTPFFPGDDDAFISRISRDATTLVASTFFGGEERDRATALAWVDGEIVIAGFTRSQIFPVSSDAFQTGHSDGETVGFITRFDAMLGTLNRSTFFAGTVTRDPAYIIDLYVEPSTGNLHTVGRTQANDLPLTSDAFDQGFTGEWEQFYSVFDADLSELVFSSFLGGTDPALPPSAPDNAPVPSANALAFGADGSLYVAGTARAVGFFTSEGAYQPDLAGGADGFVTRLLQGGLVANEDATQPHETGLLSSYPNPFVSTSTMRFQIADAETVRLAVYDVHGREVAVLVDRALPAGTHEAHLDAAGLASGTYFVRFAAGAVAETQPLTLVR